METVENKKQSVPSLAKTYSLLGAIFFIGSSFLYMLLCVYVYTVSTSPQKEPYPTLLVLGARPYENGKPNLCLVSRVDTAVSLYKKNPQTTIVVSGADNVVDQNNEALVMRQWLLDRGVDKEKIVTEVHAKNTYENIFNTTKIPNLNLGTGLTIVTESFHGARSALIARSLHLVSNLALASDSPCVKQGFFSSHFLREGFGIILYALTGRINPWLIVS